ncbi:hypothetical protein LINGRAHAP2_LOCUS22785 [Linum grandiflorum]
MSVTKEVQSVQALSRLIRSEFQPESEGLKEPKESDAPKGKPRKKATARDPSWFEHEGVRTTPSKCKYISKWGPNQPSYGETFLPMAHAYGMAPAGVTYLVCTGQHWVVLDLADVEGLLPIPEPSVSWTTWASGETTTAWANLYVTEHVPQPWTVGCIYVYYLVYVVIRYLNTMTIISKT